MSRAPRPQDTGGPQNENVSTEPRLWPTILGERSEPGACEFDLYIPEGLECWPGHFPRRPILPGVVQLGWAIRLAERWIGEKPSVSKIEVLKFKTPLEPGVRVTLRLESDLSKRRFRFVFTDGAKAYSSGRFFVEGGEE
jgi:3-hydroxymyristoyl/3-hydroxydecanoyl-(acyl carrier protein) dehydratase